MFESYNLEHTVNSSESITLHYEHNARVDYVSVEIAPSRTEYLNPYEIWLSNGRSNAERVEHLCGKDLPALSAGPLMTRCSGSHVGLNYVSLFVRRRVDDGRRQQIAIMEIRSFTDTGGR